jgi:hypothetical protein
MSFKDKVVKNVLPWGYIYLSTKRKQPHYA